MKKCASYGRELVTALDEFGSHSAPVCRQCFFNPPDEEIDLEQQIEKLKETIEDIEAESEAFAEDIADNNHQVRELSDEIKELECRLKEVENAI